MYKTPCCTMISNRLVIKKVLGSIPVTIHSAYRLGNLIYTVGYWELRAESRINNKPRITAIK
jgi:hypothetical protein